MSPLGRPGPRAFCIVRAITALKREQGRPFENVDCARQWLIKQPNVDADRIGAVGFCIGGGFAVLYAAQAPIEVVATFYGDVPKKTESLCGIAPVLGGYGKRDRIFGPGAARLASHLDALAVVNDIRIYDDAGHSYMSQHTGLTARLGSASPMRVGYNEEAAEDSWSRMLAFFAEHLQ